jgi:hypothetical protein
VSLYGTTDEAIQRSLRLGLEGNPPDAPVNLDHLAIDAVVKLHSVSGLYLGDFDHIRIRHDNLHAEVSAVQI